MASIRRQGHRFEIRECVQTEQGPRQRALARFRKILTPRVLDAAEEAASRPFDREALTRAARARGIPVSTTRQDADAKRLLARLRSGERIDPTLAGLLSEALGACEHVPLPSHLEDAAEWAGRSEAARGRGLRGLLRTASRIARSRSPVREAAPERYPRFDSGESFASCERVVSSERFA